MTYILTIIRMRLDEIRKKINCSAFVDSSQNKSYRDMRLFFFFIKFQIDRSKSDNKLVDIIQVCKLVHKTNSSREGCVRRNALPIRLATLSTHHTYHSSNSLV